ncbi:hypothetical protein UFOVP363_22 [uncultured Caudovirales phage]|uniref:Uncharacterized protein n=1 Tax=uncultured Caudovirales phage TaxID=2100421 RepID=A0A6J7WWQ0_9CAUD|nr:hypothetical protein UFOVP363_22 [uncultured Caudovirales phage]
MTTEFIQPTNPIRVWQSGEHANYCHNVFAIAISNDHDIEYLTVNGMFMPKVQIMYAEVLLEGRWQAIHVHHKPTLNPAPLDG